MESMSWFMALSLLVSKATQYTATRKHTCMLLIFLLDGGISSFINETLSSFCRSESLRQTSHRVIHSRKTFKKLFPLIVRSDHVFWKVFASRSPVSCSHVNTEPWVHLAVPLCYNQALSVKLFQREGNDLGAWLAHSCPCIPSQE